MRYIWHMTSLEAGTGVRVAGRAAPASSEARRCGHRLPLHNTVYPCTTGAGCIWGAGSIWGAREGSTQVALANNIRKNWRQAIPPPKSPSNTVYGTEEPERKKQKTESQQNAELDQLEFALHWCKNNFIQPLRRMHPDVFLRGIPIASYFVQTLKYEEEFIDEVFE